tara:strand:- start:907 stop:1092 length:186 start_codon:yes stop_codon:yes gene_type:complete
MNSPSKWISLSIPALLGVGVAWLGVAFIRSESRLKERKKELEIQLSQEETISSSNLFRNIS